MTRPSRQRGVFLVEILSVVILTAAAVVMASRLAVATYTQSRQLTAGQRSIRTTEHLLADLRRDAWAAASFKPIPRGVRLVHDGGTIDWTVDDAGTVTRTAAGRPPRRWREVAPGLTFHPEPGVLRVRWRDGREVLCVSQLQVGGGQ